MKQMLKHLVCIIILILATIILSCSNSNSSDDDQENDTSYPKLKIENVDYSYGIYSIRLLGYTFTPLDIGPGESQVFELNSGMGGGYNNIPVYIKDRTHMEVSKNCNFENGQTTIIKVKQNASMVMILE